jgi:hypothetical protein
MKTIAQQLNVKEFPFVIKDSQGRQIYYEFSNRCWYKREYNSHGNEIYYEDSNGYWWKREYNSHGNVIYYESSYGTIIDNRPKPCEGRTVEIDGITYKLTKV